MPLYELMVVMRSMQKPETIACMKRTGELLLNQGVVLRKIESLASNKDLPFKMGAHGKTTSKGSLALFRFNSAPSLPKILRTELKRDIDVIRTIVVQDSVPEEIQCTLEEELQPPMGRPSVQKLMKTGKKVEKRNPVFDKIHGPF